MIAVVARFGRPLVVPAVLLGLALPAAAAPVSTAPPLALRDRTPGLHAFTGARLVLAPGRTVERGMLVIRDKQRTLNAKYEEKYRRLGVDPGAAGGSRP